MAIEFKKRLTNKDTSRFALQITKSKRGKDYSITAVGLYYSDEDLKPGYTPGWTMLKTRTLKSARTLETCYKWCNNFFNLPHEEAWAKVHNSLLLDGAKFYEPPKNGVIIKVQYRRVSFKHRNTGKIIHVGTSYIHRDVNRWINDLKAHDYNAIVQGTRIIELTIDKSRLAEAQREFNIYKEQDYQCDARYKKGRKERDLDSLRAKYAKRK